MEYIDKKILAMRIDVVKFLISLKEQPLEKKIFPDISDGIIEEGSLITTANVEGKEGIYVIIDFTSKQDSYPTDEKLKEHTLNLYRKFASSKVYSC
ncbi:MAG TPA: hypothetical protein VJ208_02875 [Candidatus Nanoarchaeia archaeon]|nr:hypothetical protein [Candidatus Nanoarchaeia archaeon]